MAWLCPNRRRDPRGRSRSTLFRPSNPLLAVLVLALGLSVSPARAQAAPPDPTPEKAVAQPNLILPNPNPIPLPTPLPGPGLPPSFDDELGPEVPAPPGLLTGACRVGCGGANGCAVLPPALGATRDDGAEISRCLSQCRCVQLVPRPKENDASQLETKFLVRQAIGGFGMGGPLKLTGSAGSGNKLPLLKAVGTCNDPAFLDTAKRMYKPVLDFANSPDGVISDLRLQVADFKQSCRSHSLIGAFVVNVNKSPRFRIENLSLAGQTPARNADTGAGTMGGIQVSFSPDAIVRRNRVSDLGYAIGDNPAKCETANGVAGIKVADSRKAVIDNNDIFHVSFGIAVVNENSDPNGNTSNGARITNNRITGAARLQCEIVGTFKGAECDPMTAAFDRTKIRCSQGRALRVAGIATNVVSNVCVENNWAVQFGGREGQPNASGLDLTGYVQGSRFRNNIFDGRGSVPDFAFQPRAVADDGTLPSPALFANTVDNLVQGNVFLGSDKCDVNFQSLKGTQVVADQCGLTRTDTGSQAQPNSGNNRFALFPSKCGQGTAAPGRCSGPDVPPAPPLPPIPPLGGGPPPVNPNACAPLAAPAPMPAPVPPPAPTPTPTPDPPPPPPPAPSPGAPRIDRVFPASGPAGSDVTLSGANFAGATVTVGGIRVALLDGSATSLTVGIPDFLRAGSTSIVVTTPNGSATATFRVLAALP